MAKKRTARSAARKVKDLKPRRDAKGGVGKTLGGKAKIIDGRFDLRP
jgi:hypothetical protein